MARRPTHWTTKWLTGTRHRKVGHAIRNRTKPLAVLAHRRWASRTFSSRTRGKARHGTIEHQRGKYAQVVGRITPLKYPTVITARNPQPSDRYMARKTPVNAITNRLVFIYYILSKRHRRSRFNLNRSQERMRQR